MTDARSKASPVRARRPDFGRASWWLPVLILAGVLADLAIIRLLFF